MNNKIKNIGTLQSETIPTAEKSTSNSIERIVLEDGSAGFRGPFLETVYDNYDECHRENEKFIRIKNNKEMGLNEHGQTPEQIKKMQEKREMVQKIKKIEEEAARMRAELQNFDASDDVEFKKKGKK